MPAWPLRFQLAERGKRRSGVRGRDGRGEDERAGAVAHEVGYAAAGGHIAAEGSKRLGERAHVDIDMGFKAIIAGCAAASLADDAEAVEIEMTIDLAASTAERAGLKIHATEDGAYTYVAYDDQIGRVVVDRQAMANGDRGYRAAPLTDAELASGKLDLRVFVDRGSVEVYVNGGHQVLSSYSYASEGPRAIKLVAESGSLKVDSLKLHHMKSIGLE